MSDPEQAAAKTLAVCICTCRRPTELRALLTRLVGEAAELDARGIRAGVVVVDDDPEGSAEPVSAEFVGSFPGGTHYERTGSGNISVARNRAMTAGVARAELVAFIDDDCLPDPGWLAALTEMQSVWSADAVSGRCIDVAVDGAPLWLSAQPFLEAQTPPADGALIDIGAMKNLLVSSSAIARTGIRFDETFGRVGGEDVMFFHAAATHHLTVRFADGAVVREVVPLGRSTFRYQFSRHVWYGNTEAVTSIASHRYTRARMFVSGLRHVVMSVVRLATRVGSRRPPAVRWTICQVGRGVGRAAGACGLKRRHH